MMRFAIAHPFTGCSEIVFRISRSSVPWTRSLGLPNWKLSLRFRLVDSQTGELAKLQRSSSDPASQSSRLDHRTEIHQHLSEMPNGHTGRQITFSGHFR
jgi:hypothetical protein